MARLRYEWLGVVLLGLASAAPAVTFTGRVVGPGGTPVPSVDIDVENAATGVALVTPGDNTNAQGVFNFVAPDVPGGTYNIAFLPVFAAGLADFKRFNVVAQGPTINLGDVQLAQGFAVTGQVTTPQGAPVNDVDMDVEDSFTGERVPTHSDHSGIDGTFQFRVPQGTHDFLSLPPKVLLRAAAIRNGVAVNGDISLGQIQVQPGFLLSGRVARPGGAPAVDVDIDIIDAATGDLIPTVEDNTDGAGNYSVVVPAGTFSVEVNPLIGAGLTHGLVLGETIDRNQVLNFDLPATSVATEIARTGRLAPAGSAYPYSVTLRNTTGGTAQVNAQIFLRDPRSGLIVTILGPVPLPLPPNFGPATVPLTLPIPASVPAELRNRSIEIGILVTDTASGALRDFDLTRFMIP